MPVTFGRGRASETGSTAGRERTSPPSSEMGVRRLSACFAPAAKYRCETKATRDACSRRERRRSVPRARTVSSRHRFIESHANGTCAASVDGDKKAGRAGERAVHEHATPMRRCHHRPSSLRGAGDRATTAGEPPCKEEAPMRRSSRSHDRVESPVRPVRHRRTRCDESGTGDRPQPVGGLLRRQSTSDGLVRRHAFVATYREEDGPRRTGRCVRLRRGQRRRRLDDVAEVRTCPSDFQKKARRARPIRRASNPKAANIQIAT